MYDSKRYKCTFRKSVYNRLSCDGKYISVEDVFIISNKLSKYRSCTGIIAGTQDGSGYFANNGSAGNIKIEIGDADVSSVTYGPNTIKTVSVQNNNATFNLKARAVSKGQVTPGDISSVITVTYTYS